MADDGVASCQLCLNADEVDSMMVIDIPHHLIDGAPPVTICRQCVATIHVAGRKQLAEELAAGEGEDDEPAE